LNLQRTLLDLELQHWRRAGRPARLWWRDDDARGPTPALDRLLGLSLWHSVPLTLAVIPDEEPARLAWSLAACPLATVAQHGVDHTNRRDGQAAGEFPYEWRRLRVATQLRAGWTRLQALPGAQPVFVPPWNDIHPELPGALEDCGYLGWSAWADAGDRGPLPRIDAHLDLLRWKSGVRFRGEGRFLEAFRAALRARRRAGRWDAPIGLLTHHLDHDEAAWVFLADFLGWTSERPEIAWRGLGELLAEQTGAHRRRPEPVRGQAGPCPGGATTASLRP
jgi:hypothetical protein